MLILPFFAFLSGIVTILSPCILPVLPIVLSGSVGGKRKPLGIIAGFIGSFSLFTLLLSSLVSWLGIPPNALRFVAVIIISLFGLTLLLPELQKKYEMFTSGLIKHRDNSRKSGFSGGFAIGASLGLIWTPCVGPILASVITLAVSRQADGGAFLIMLAYAAGTSIPMLGIMSGGRKLINRFPGLSGNTAKIQRGFGVIMLTAALAIGFGWDRRFQTSVLEIFPGYGAGLTRLENTEAVQNALNTRRDPGESSELNWSEPPEKGRLEFYGKAPDLIAAGPWFNSVPLTMEELKGKVVVVDFWTYSCINCVRTLPYLKTWYDTYKDDGLVIIGVHSPEFAFERDPGNVQKAMQDLNVTWPVALDNDFRQWSSYNNRFWPAHYFIDVQGNIRYFHFGEGEYETGEEVIRKLLKEGGLDAGEASGATDPETMTGQTPETYLGYGRTEGFLSGEAAYAADKEFSIPGIPGNGEWGLEGLWTFRRNYIESSAQGSLELGFNAKDVFLVIEPLEKSTRIRIFLDNRETGQIEPDTSRMYQLIKLEKSGSHLLRLEVEGKVRFYAFTFG